MKKKIKNQKQIENVVLTDNDEPMIDGKRLSEVFDVLCNDFKDFLIKDDLVKIDKDLPNYFLSYSQFRCICN